MKKNTPASKGLLITISVMAIVISVMIGLDACHNKLNNNVVNVTPYSKTLSHIPADSAYKWADWNVLFKPSSTVVERNQIMTSLQDSIVAYLTRLNDSTGRADVVEVNIVFCPCDSLLYNLVSNIPLGAVGTLATKPPKVPPTGTSGEPVQYVLQNNSLKDSTQQNNLEKYVENGKKYYYTVDSSKTLAVMDTGLDTTLFQDGFHGLLWTDEKEPTLRNFLGIDYSKDNSYYYDDDKNKHGSAVTSTALEALRKFNTANHKLPRVMVMKVLDSNGTGSTFTLSCALSYARQKKATLINASMGYYSKHNDDSVLRHYVELCAIERPNPIPIIAAAGNLPGIHKFNLIHAPVNIHGPNHNLLDETHLFYPGCFSTDFSNVICVTGLASETMPCFYQNYSSVYVSAGVITNPSSENCCISGISFFKQKKRGYDGSSFAAPVISGQMMAKLLTVDMAPLSAFATIGTPLTAIVGLTGTTPPVVKKVITYKSIP